MFADRTWKKNRQELAGMPGVGNMYDDLILAFGHIKRINYFYLTRALSGGIVRADDNLPAATAAIRKALRAVEDQLSDLG
jgi:hypothetical protein